MGLFQNTILKKYLKGMEDKISLPYSRYAAYFRNPEIQENIRNSREEQFQEGFLRELFVKILGYTLYPQPNHNLITEQKNEKDSKKADGAIVINGEVKAVIELKDHKTTDLKQVEAQAFGYKNYHRRASYVVISNFEKLRFYIDNAVDYEEFNLFSLTKDDFSVLWICLACENIAKDLPKQLKNESNNSEDQITRKLYRDYSAFKQALFDNMLAHNREISPLVMFKKTQKLLDRFLFVFFAEDKGLLPPNSMKRIIDQWDKRNEDPLNEYQPLYGRFKIYFKYMNEGHKGKIEDIFGYNGGLFKPDEILNTIAIDDDILKENILKLVVYDFDTEVDVNILGHIFEHSLTEIEEITNALSDKGINSPVKSPGVSKRKKDGVFYTPRYITAYIVENTLGKLCTDKKAALAIDESEYFADRKRPKAQTRQLSDKLKEYRDWLRSLTICDPACGSGAFLNAALDFLIAEHRLIDEMYAKIHNVPMVLPEIECAILENNLYGVDINEESVEIAKLALWLRTAKPNRKLNSLNDNIKCGNSLISPLPLTRGLIPLLSLPETEKAFDWHREFPQIFKEKDKKAFHVTTAIHDSRTSQRMIDCKVRERRFQGTLPEPQIYPLDEDDELIITKTVFEIVKEDELNVLAYNICRDHLHILLVCETEELDKIVGKIKGRTARVYNLRKGINPLVKETGERSVPLWTQKFGCKEITDEQQLYNTIEYIQNNRIKHKLPTNKGIHPLAEEMLCTIDHAFRPEYNGGFDVVIGNPPYGAKISEIEKKILKEVYPFVGAKTKDTYIFFVFKMIELLKNKGQLGIIIPNTWLLINSAKEVREKILEYKISEIIDYGDDVFEDATVESLTLILENQKSNEKVSVKRKKGFSTLNSNIIDKDVWKKNADTRILIDLNDKIINFLDNISSNCCSFSECGEIIWGIKPYQVGHGEPKQTKEMLSDRVYHSCNKIDKKWKPLVVGSNVNRYILNTTNIEYILYGKNLMYPSNEEKIQKPKLLMRQTSDILRVTLDTQSYYPQNSLFIITTLENARVDLRYLMILLNSNLLNFIYKIKNPQEGKTFAEIKPSVVKSLPIKNISIPKQQPFIVLADKMLSLNSDLQIKRQRFLKRLSDNFTGIKITGTLERFDELEFKQFLSELKKQKISLSLKQQDEWEEYFDEYKTECTNIAGQINSTDKEIDAMVYGLYGLTEEEIGIIDPDFWKNNRNVTIKI